MCEALPGTVNLGRVHRHCEGGQECGEALRRQGRRQGDFPWDQTELELGGEEEGI